MVGRAGAAVAVREHRQRTIRLAELGHPPKRSVDRVSARVPTQEQFQALRLPGSLPVLCTLWVVSTEAGRPVEATAMVKAGHLYEVEYEFTPE